MGKTRPIRPLVRTFRARMAAKARQGIRAEGWVWDVGWVVNDPTITGAIRLVHHGAPVWLERFCEAVYGDEG